jgi:amidase
VHPDAVAAARDAAHVCEELGHEVVEAAPAVDPERLVEAFFAVFGAGVGWQIDALAIATHRVPSPDLVEPTSWALHEQSRGTSAAQYLMAVQYLQLLGREMGRFLADYDVWLTPTTAEPPVPLGTFDAPPDNPIAPLMRAAAFVPFTPVCNATGQPAMSVPLFWSDEGLPIGAHFAGRFGDEATLLRLAAQLEAARPWAERRPPA